MSWKTYSHEIKFMSSPFVLGLLPEDLRCISCAGTGYSVIDFGPGSVTSFPYPKCEICSGKGRPPIPACEVGL